MAPGGVVDAELSLVIVDDAAGNPLALVTSFAAHPTTLGAWNRQLSADYPGVLAQMVEARYPEAVCLFVAGAVGDQGPVKQAPPPKSLVGGQGSGFEAAQHLGGALAAKAVALIEGPPRGEMATLAASQRVVALPKAQVRLGRWTLPGWLSRGLVDDDATLSVVSVGSALFIGVPCDLGAELGVALKRAARARGFQPLIVGFANDYIGYCMAASVYPTDRYEATMMFNGPSAGELVVEELTQMIDQIVTSDK
jgi:hypothetical protein